MCRSCPAACSTPAASCPPTCDRVVRGRRRAVLHGGAAAQHPLRAGRFLAIFLIGRKEWNGRVGWLALDRAGLPARGDRLGRPHSLLLATALLRPPHAVGCFCGNPNGCNEQGVAALARACTFSSLPFSIGPVLAGRNGAAISLPAPCHGVVARLSLSAAAGAVIGQLLLCLGGMVLRFAMEQIGQPGTSGRCRPTNRTSACSLSSPVHGMPTANCWSAHPDCPCQFSPCWPWPWRSSNSTSAARAWPVSPSITRRLRVSCHAVPGNTGSDVHAGGATVA